MRATTSFAFFLALPLAFFSATASPVFARQNFSNSGSLASTADACKTEDLSSKTWTSLKLDSWLSDFVSTNLSDNSKDVQGLASAFGAPNFFCGLDSFCNAGQPCVPVDLPDWYVLVAIQNWNSYMNSLNTAITFASSIMSLTLPGIVKDFYPQPEDNITPLKTLIAGFTSVIGIVPFTGAISTSVTVLSGSASFINTQLKVPAATDLFVAWSDISTSLGKIVTSYQASVSDSITKTLKASPDTKTIGINGLLDGGRFLGVNQNFTQADLQEKVTSTLQTYSIALVLQAQKVFVSRSRSTEPTDCPDSNQPYSEICTKGDDGYVTQTILTKGDGDGNSAAQEDTGKLLTDKYGIPISQYVTGVLKCYDDNNKQQLTNPFNVTLPLDSGTECLFNLLVCDAGASTDGIIKTCQKQGLDV